MIGRLYILLLCFAVSLCYARVCAVSLPVQQLPWAGGISSYGWKSYFFAYDNETILNSLKRFCVNEFFLSPGDDRHPKTADFLQSASAVGIEVARLIGENSYVEVENGFGRLQKKMESIKAAGFTSIHLDIEPHVLKDYKECIEMYTQRFNRLISLSHSWCEKEQVSLSVSIPMHTASTTAFLLAELNIQSYIMAYENPDQERLLKRTEWLRNILDGQYIWVVRAQDFEDSAHLRSALFLLERHAVHKLGVYDIKAMEVRY